MAIKILKIERDFVEIPLIKGGMAKAIIWPGMGTTKVQCRALVKREFANGGDGRSS